MRIKDRAPVFLNNSGLLILLSALIVFLSSCDENGNGSNPSLEEGNSVRDSSNPRHQELANEIIANTERIFACVLPVNDAESAGVAVVAIQESEKRLLKSYDDLRVLDVLPPEDCAGIKEKFESSFVKMGSLQNEVNVVIKSLDPESAGKLTKAILGTSNIYKDYANTLKRHGFVE